MEPTQHKPHSRVLRRHKKIKIQTDNSDFDGSDFLPQYRASMFLYPNWEVGFMTLFDPQGSPNPCNNNICA